MYEHHALSSADEIPDERFVVGAKKLGEGGMGIVYAGFDLQAFERRAIKWNQYGNAKRDQREIECTDRVGSLYPEEFVKLHAVVHVEKVRADSILRPSHAPQGKVMVMEYLEGLDACDFFLQQKNSVNAVARDFARRLFQAIQHCHEAEVIHRDIQVSNIKITQDADGDIDSIKIFDFGHAAVVVQNGDSPDPYSLFGNPAYMPPECFRPTLPRATHDIFSAGVVMAQILGGEIPVDEKTYEKGERKWRKLKKKYHPSTYIPSGADTVLRRVVERCLQYDCKDRYQSAQEALADLQ